MLRSLSVRFFLFLLLCMSPKAIAQDWQPLFDGYSFSGWMHEDGSAVSTPGWEVTEGMLHLDRQNGEGGNLLSAERYGDFELLFNWKLAKGANNGVKYRVNNFDGRYLGIEYQVIDDLTQTQLQPKHRTASLYDIYEPAEHQLFRPEGEFNRSRIVVRNNHIEHWLNGHLLTEAHVGDAEWMARLAKSKFSDVPGFGVIPTGHIMLTDHQDEVWYRNIFIRRLDQVVQHHAMTAVSSSRVCPAPKRFIRRRCRFGRRR